MKTKAQNIARIKVKTDEELRAMKEGGKKLSKIKKELISMIKEGVSASEIDDRADLLIARAGAEPSFKMVPGYRWATCVNVNAGVVHGIPHKHIVFKKGDVVSVDVGIFYKGLHTDTSDTVAISPDPETKRFLEAGEEALQKAISKADPGNRIWDISNAIESTIQDYGYSPIRALVGHGVGRELHEDPQIPCFTKNTREDSPEIPERAVFAIEVMYAKGSYEVVVERADGWTISTKDGKMSALFEETVAVVHDGHIVLTKV